MSCVCRVSWCVRLAFGPASVLSVVLNFAGLACLQQGGGANGGVAEIDTHLGMKSENSDLHM